MLCNIEHEASEAPSLSAAHVLQDRCTPTRRCFSRSAVSQSRHTDKATSHHGAPQGSKEEGSRARKKENQGDSRGEAGEGRQMVHLEDEGLSRVSCLLSARPAPFRLQWSVCRGLHRVTHTWRVDEVTLKDERMGVEKSLMQPP